MPGSAGTKEHLPVMELGLGMPWLPGMKAHTWRWYTQYCGAVQTIMYDDGRWMMVVLVVVMVTTVAPLQPDHTNGL